MKYFGMALLGLVCALAMTLTMPSWVAAQCGEGNCNVCDSGGHEWLAAGDWNSFGKDFHDCGNQSNCGCSAHCPCENFTDQGGEKVEGSDVFFDLTNASTEELLAAVRQHPEVAYLNRERMALQVHGQCSGEAIIALHLPLNEEQFLALSALSPPEGN